MQYEALYLVKIDIKIEIKLIYVRRTCEASRK